MDLITVDQYIQYIAWFLALAELIIALYLCILNPRHTANRHVSLLLLITAVNTYALGMMTTAVTQVQALVSANILAMTTYAVQPLLLVTSIALLKPDWLHGKQRWLFLPIYGLMLLPSTLTLIDRLFGFNLWYSSIDPGTYTGGFITTPNFTNGSLSILIRAGSILSLSITVLLLLYIALVDKQTNPKNRNLAWVMLLPVIITGAALYNSPPLRLPSVVILISNSAAVLSYAFAAFKQMNTEHRQQRGSLQTRLTIVVLIVSLTVMVAFTVFIVDRAQRLLTPYDIGDAGIVYIVNAENQIVAHSDLSRLDESLDFSGDPAVTKLRQGYLGPYTLTDSDGIRWRTKAGLLSDGWGVIVQTPAEQLQAPRIRFGRMAWISLATAAFLLLILTFFMISQTIYPLRSLTQITTAVAAGDLTKVAPVLSDDEIGALAQSFNSMTLQVQSLIRGLEERVFQRTQDLERRAIQLQVAAEVAQEAAEIRDLPSLLEGTVKLISDRFGFYHAGIFIIDDAREYAVLAAASSEGGRHMLARKHQLRIGKVGIVGHVAASGEPRIALDVGVDAVFFNNPDLPETHSEMALPMKAHGIVVGVLDVQSTETAAFREEDIDILQILADQIALAIENARLLETNEESLHKLESMYNSQVGQAWKNRLEETHIEYSYDRLGVHRITSPSEITEIRVEDPDTSSRENRIAVPIILHGHHIGSLQLHRDDNSPWTSEDREIVDVITSQISLALDSARIQEADRLRSQNEQLVNRISVRTQSALDLETVMKRAVQEIGQALKAEKVQILLQTNGAYPDNRSPEQ